MADAMLIINPISGTSKKKGLDSKVEKAMRNAGYNLDVRYTGCRGDATRLAAEAVEKGYEVVLAAGGDGTVNETAQALCETPVRFGIIPSGSGNGLARHIGIPISVDGALEVVGRGIVAQCDYGTVNRHPFFCTFGVGFDAAVSHNFAKQSKRGLFTYLKSALTQYINYRPDTYTISANGKILTERAFVVACCNASQYGNNAYIAPKASITDGLLDIIIIHQGSPIDTAMVGMDLFTGYIDSNTLIHSLRTPAAVIYRTNEGPAHIDGEPMILDDIMDIKCHHAGLNIFIPGDKQPFRPLITPFRSIWNSLFHHK
ncbi:MAG: diacylglycerol kinase family lipid kinase [Bacteroidales bacterium]|nr:diacylglycerol kinase family lipid kinase [Bacteroidales bacterium]